MAIVQPELQQRTLRLYGELLARRAEWAGQLVLAAFDGASATGFAAAASLAGAASLTVDGNTVLMKEHFRDGAFDFVVNTLDEALRAIKNEVRQGRPIAIGLMAEPAAVVAEALERGLLPRLVLTSSRESSELSGEFVLREGEASAVLDAWLAERGWGEAMVDSGAAEPVDAIRLRWWKHLAAHQRSVRGAQRAVWSHDNQLRDFGPQGLYARFALR